MYVGHAVRSSAYSVVAVIVMRSQWDRPARERSHSQSKSPNSNTVTTPQVVPVLERLLCVPSTPDEDLWDSHMAPVTKDIVVSVGFAWHGSLCNRIQAHIEFLCACPWLRFVVHVQLTAFAGAPHASSGPRCRTSLQLHGHQATDVPSVHSCWFAAAA